MHYQFSEGKLNGVKIIHADEAVFTFNTFAKRAWSSAYNSISVVDRKITVKTTAIIAGISEDKGLETYLLHPKAISTEQYLEFLEKLAAIYSNQRIILFLDNLNVHKTEEAREAYERLRITAVFNVAYSPQFNGIESYWSVVKYHYKRQLLFHLMRDETIDTEELIV